MSVWKLPQCSPTHNRDVNTMFIAEASALSVSPRLAAHSNLWEDINTRQLCGVTLIRNKNRQTLLLGGRSSGYCLKKTFVPF